MVSTDRAMVSRGGEDGDGTVSRGCQKSCMGTAARSAISRGEHQLEGSSSPTWRLPMRRMPTMIKEVE